MPINGYALSSQTLFSPRQNGQSHAHRTPVTASAEPSAVRPAGLSSPPPAANGHHTVAAASPVEGERPAVRGWQDKGARDRAPKGTSQPAPGTESERRSVSDTGSDRSPDSIDDLVDDLRRSARMTLWVKPGVKTALGRLAKDDGISLSETAAKGLEVFARAKIHDQEETLFEPRMQAMLRREIRASDNRHIYFEMRNAIAAEQTRILITDLYKQQRQKEGVPLKKINEKLDETYNMARDNILRKTKSPQLRNLLAQWWRATDEQAEPRHEQSESREMGNTDEGEAGNGISPA